MRPSGQEEAKEEAKGLISREIGDNVKLLD